MSTPIPVKIEAMKTMTTRKIWKATPMPALPAKPDQVSDQGMIHHALEAADHILKDGRPRQLPDGRADGSFDEGAIEPRGLGRHGAGKVIL